MKVWCFAAACVGKEEDTLRLGYCKLYVGRPFDLAGFRERSLADLDSPCLAYLHLLEMEIGRASIVQLQ